MLTLCSTAEADHSGLHVFAAHADTDKFTCSTAEADHSGLHTMTVSPRSTSSRRCSTAEADHSGLHVGEEETTHSAPCAQRPKPITAGCTLPLGRKADG